ncbi:MAG TPA: DUF4179 domain-containing protein [Metabacillus sp.]|nr:DUF4179 domain-containing protein [Metabacillus sp.]
MSNDYQDLLNIDIDNIEPKHISKERKLEIKQHVLSKTNGKKRTYLHTLTAAALIGVTVITGSIMTAPALANQLPFIQSILSYFEKDTLPNKYVDLATVVNQVQSSNGIDVMIENAVYDGTNVMITYAIQTKENLGDQPISEGYIDVQHANAIGGTGFIEKTNVTTYVGVEKVTPHFQGKSPEAIMVKWQPKVFKNIEENKQYGGDWTFEFTLSQLPTTTQLLNETREQEGLTFVLKSLEHSEMASVLHYEFSVDKHVLKEWPFVLIEIMVVKDNLGNIYEVNGNGGISHDNGASQKSEATIYSIHPDASSLTLTPRVYYSQGSGKGVELEEMKPITIHIK